MITLAWWQLVLIILVTSALSVRLDNVVMAILHHCQGEKDVAD